MRNEAAYCPALLIGAPASGQGKTTATAALARWHRNQGRRVRVFKVGPDFLDPMLLARASGQAVYQLDLWMGSVHHCGELLYRAAREADLILVEGVMGLHDGSPSSADLARQFGIPVLAIIDGTAMGQTFGAIAHGLASYRPDLSFAGVVANRVGSAMHADMLRESLPERMAWFGALPRGDAYALPSRHLGLVQAQEIADLEARIESAAKAFDAVGIPLPEPVRFESNFVHVSPDHMPGMLAGVCIAVASDEAFSFIYQANLDTLRALGADLVFFSPLHDASLPHCQALYLPGGYPELHLKQLSGNVSMQEAVRAHHACGKPIVAECGGMLALLESLTPVEGRPERMWGLIAGRGVMEKRRVNLGMHSAELPEGHVRGHTFHHARMETSLLPIALTQAQRKGGTPEHIYRVGRMARLHASFMHMYFPSNPMAIARLFCPTEGLA